MKYYYNLQSFFEDIVNTYYSDTAIVMDNKVFTYGELNKRSKDFIYYFILNDITQGDVVLIANTKSFDDYALMIACLKSGIIYVNLDIDNPVQRLTDIINLCKGKILFSNIDDAKLTKVCRQNKISAIQYKELDATIKTELQLQPLDGETVAYIMFTSGSTGIPKGVAVTHQNLIHLIFWIKERYEITNKDNFANISPMYFDNSVFDFYGALFSGAKLTPIKKELLSNPVHLVKYIDNMQCTIWFSVPSMLMYLMTMKVLTRDVLKSIRIFTFGGEGYPKSELKKIFDLYAKRAKFINVYGPTEGTCICSSYDIASDDFNELSELPSLGRINQNFSYVVLDKSVESEVGELCLMGPNISKGYYNDSERTAKAFCVYTSKKHYMKNMYKTGDIVEERKGLLYFKGRIDNQIKHMGYRIELEEIENAIYSYSKVCECAVVYKRSEISYGKIVSYIVSQTDIEIKELRLFLKKKLPDYMIPNSFVFLDILPKNQNGKIDRKELALK